MVMKVRMIKLFLLCGLLLSVLIGCGSRSSNPSSTTITSDMISVQPASTDELLVNPGKGWVIYDNIGWYRRNEAPWQYQTSDTWALASVGYTRYYWVDLEPAEGQYRWDIIDRELTECTAQGKQFAFGVIMGADPTSGLASVTPEYVFSVGAKFGTYQCQNMFSGATFTQKIPNFSDPIYLAKVREFAAALSNRYGNNRNFAFIDIRCFGSWGENSYFNINGLYKPQTDTGVDGNTMQNCWQAFIDGFSGSSAQLIVPYGLPCDGDVNFALIAQYQWAVNQGIGIRRDGILHPFDNFCKGKELRLAIDKAPGIFEFAGAYTWLVQEGAYSNDGLIAGINLGCPTYCNLGQWQSDGVTYLAQQRAAIEKMTNMLGYYFVLKEADFSKNLGIGASGTITMKWSNQGVAPVYFDCYIALALVDPSNNIVAKCWLNTVNPRTWLPEGDLSGDKTTVESSAFTFPNVAAGNYQLAIGLFSNKSKAGPDIKLGIEGRLNSGWYLLGK